MEAPFRWNVSRREQLGRLPAGDEAESYPEFIDDLRTCAARVIALCEDSDLVFVGRSPESIFDYLSGTLSGTSWASRLSLLNVSVHDTSGRELKLGAGADVHVLRDQLSALHLDPREIATRPRNIALVDLVWSGHTLETLTEAMIEWAREQDFDVAAVRRRLRFVGITWRKKTSPNTWRWHQNAAWLTPFLPSVVKNVSVPGRLWDYLGNKQKKVARTQPRWRWRDEQWRLTPPREYEHLESLRLALRIYDTGCSREEQHLFARELADQPALSKPWLRALVGELRRTVKSRSA